MLDTLWSRLRCDLAVDLGTANTQICAPGAGVVLDEPSVVAVEGGSRQVLAGGYAVGHLARQLLGRAPDDIVVVRPLAGGVIADLELCQAMLHAFLQKARRRGWTLRPRLVLTAPGQLTQVERRALIYSAQRAGAGEVWLLSQARAAALGAGLPLGEPTAQMICDIGSGTTELALFSLGEIVAARSLRVGGDAMDEALVRHLRRHAQLKLSPAAAERLRISLGTAVPETAPRREEASGIDTVTGLPRKAQVSSQDVLAALAEPLEQLVEAVKAVLEQTSAELTADLLDHGLTLTGGAAQLRGLPEFLRQRTGLPARLAVAAPLAAARGALACLEQLPASRPLLESGDEVL